MLQMSTNERRNILRENQEYIEVCHTQVVQARHVLMQMNPKGN